MNKTFLLFYSPKPRSHVWINGLLEHRLSTQTIPEITGAEACTHSLRSFYSGELQQLILYESECIKTCFVLHNLAWDHALALLSMVMCNPSLLPINYFSFVCL